MNNPLSDCFQSNKPGIDVLVGASGNRKSVLEMIIVFSRKTNNDIGSNNDI